MEVLETPSVRGTFVLNTFDFIREHYSPAAHTMVLQMLPVPRPSLSEARETSWTPLEDLVAYIDRKSTRLNSSHLVISYAVFCLKKKKKTTDDVVVHVPADRCSVSLTASDGLW